MKSPSGKIVVPSVGPLDAPLVFVAESPGKNEVEQGVPLVGRAGEMANLGWRHAGIDRSRSRIINLVPVRAPHDKFEQHNHADILWGHDLFLQEIAQLQNTKVIVPMGFHALNWLSGGMAPIPDDLGLRPYHDTYGKTHGGIGDWRGSPLDPQDPLLALWPQFKPISTIPLLPTFHPSAVARDFEKHVDFVRDLKRAKQLSEGRLLLRPVRTTYVNDYMALDRLVHQKRPIVAEDGEMILGGANRPLVDLIAFDTEQGSMAEQELVSIATEDEIHVFNPTEPFIALLKELLESPYVCKVAHNFQHDAVWLAHRFDIHIVPPRFDTYGGAHILNPSLEKTLSPGISARFTTGWPFHKWLEQIDLTEYAGIDAAVTYDAFWSIQEEIHERGLNEVSAHDHKLMDIFIDMTLKGFRVDVAKRDIVEAEMKAELAIAEAALQHHLLPVIQQKYDKFTKPHLFKKLKQCECCGGGSLQVHHCPGCGRDGVEKLTREIAKSHGYPTIKAYKGSWPACRTCHGQGKIEEWIPFNADSPDQVADVIYRGLGFAPRTFHRKQTVRIKQLESLRHEHPLIAEILDVQQLRADMETVERLGPGYDGRLHCVFDPWGTKAGRVAGKKGLILPGTNPMNIPKPARVFVVPDPESFLMYPDMEQIEARAAAVLTKDPGLYQALTEIIPERGKPDIHLFVLKALRSVGVEPVDVTGHHDVRFMTKKLEYASFFGIRAPNLAKEAGFASVQDAQKALDAFGYLFPGVPKWHRDTLAEALDTRELRSPTGRIRTWTGYIYDAKTKTIAYEVAKEMWSFKMQDMAAWVLALGAIELAEEHPWIELLIHVHDALLMQAPLTRSEEAIKIATQALSREVWGMYFPAEMNTGSNWKEASA